MIGRSFITIVDPHMLCQVGWLFEFLRVFEESDFFCSFKMLLRIAREEYSWHLLLISSFTTFEGSVFLRFYEKEEGLTKLKKNCEFCGSVTTSLALDL